MSPSPSTTVERPIEPPRLPPVAPDTTPPPSGAAAALRPRSIGVAVAAVVVTGFIVGRLMAAPTPAVVGTAGTPSDTPAEARVATPPPWRDECEDLSERLVEAMTDLLSDDDGWALGADEGALVLRVPGLSAELRSILDRLRELGCDPRQVRLPERVQQAVTARWGTFSSRGVLGRYLAFAVAPYLTIPSSVPPATHQPYDPSTVTPRPGIRSPHAVPPQLGTPTPAATGR